MSADYKWPVGVGPTGMFWVKQQTGVIEPCVNRARRFWNS